MNKVMLIGRLTKEPQLKYTSGNKTAVCQFTIAVDRRFKSDNQPTADFIPVVAWRQTAEFVSKYFNKGSRIAVVGQIQTRSWEDDNGQKHYATEVLADNVEFCESKKQDSVPRPTKTPNLATTEAGFNDDCYFPPIPSSPPELNPEGYYPMPEEDDDCPF